jgi:adenosylcobyric acid synthase
VEDLRLLRSRGLDRAFAERARRGLPTLGVCGGYQMLGGRILDGVESATPEVPGLGLLPVETAFGPEKVLARPEGLAPGFANAPVSGYEIHHGRTTLRDGEPLFVTRNGTEGCRVGATLGTSWHGVLESDGFRRALLLWVAGERGLDWRSGAEPFAAAREAQLEKLGDLVAENVNREALLRTVEAGAPAGLPVVSCQLSALSGQQAAKGDRSRTEASRRNGEAPASEQAALAAKRTDGGGGKAGG